MRALSFWQPWAYAMLHLGKSVENRQKWTSCSYRGPLAIHASIGCGKPEEFHGAALFIVKACAPGPDPQGWAAPFAELRPSKRGGPRLWCPSPDLHRGGIVGTGRLIAEIVPDPEGRGGVYERPGGQRTRWLTPDEERWWMRGFGLLLAEVKAVPFIVYKGKQGWMEIPDDALAAGGIVIEPEPPAGPRERKGRQKKPSAQTSLFGDKP